MKNGPQNDPRGSKMIPRGARMDPKGPNLDQKGAKRGTKKHWKIDARKEVGSGTASANPPGNEKSTI